MKQDQLAEAAVEYFAARSHDAWRREFHKNNPSEKGKPRLRERGGEMVDINQPYSKLHPKAKAENKIAAHAAFEAVTKFPNDREAAAAYVHKCWIARNKADPSQNKDLFKPYTKLPEIEKDKDRAHVDAIKVAIAAVSGKVGKPKGKSAASAQSPTKGKSKKSKASPPKAKDDKLGLDEALLRRVSAAAERLSASGRKTTSRDLLRACVEAGLVVLEAGAPLSKKSGKKA